MHSRNGYTCANHKEVFEVAVVRQGNLVVSSTKKKNSGGAYVAYFITQGVSDRIALMSQPALKLTCSESSKPGTWHEIEMSIRISKGTMDCSALTTRGM